jgi:hypothetical protein
MNTELAGTRQFLSPAKAQGFERDAIRFTMLNTFTALCLLIAFTILGLQLIKIGRPIHAAFYFLFGALVAPLLTPLAAFSAGRIAKTLTSDCDYQKVVKWALWQRLSIFLLICYILIFSLVTDLSMTIPGNPLK